MLRFDFEESPGWWIIRTARVLKQTMATELRPLGITYRQCQVLASIARHGPLSQADLARDLAIEPPTLTGVISRMERDGWVERRPCPGDARKKLVHPLPRAEDVWDRIVATAEPLRRRAAHGLSQRDLENLHSLLRRIGANVTDLTAEEPVR